MLADVDTRKIDRLNVQKCFFSKYKNNIDIFSHLFDTIVKPTLLYGSEIWGMCRSLDIERAHTFAFKRFLNVSLHTSNTLLYGESGRYPLYICSALNAIRYWGKLLPLSNERLCKQAYLTSYNMCENGHTNWASSVKDILLTN